MSNMNGDMGGVQEMNSDDEARPAKRARNSNWTESEMMCLASAKHEEYEAWKLNNPGSDMVVTELNWMEIAKFMEAQGVTGRDSTQCSTKWGLLSKQYKKIKDHPEYWSMSVSDRGAAKLPAGFNKKLFDTMDLSLSESSSKSARKTPSTVRATKPKAASEKGAKAAKAGKQPLLTSFLVHTDANTTTEDTIISEANIATEANTVSENIQRVTKFQTKKTIEETYQKKTQLEHILLRPDTYVGSIEKHSQPLWVYEDGGMVSRTVSFVPGLYKIFDEILVNAADNKQRDPTMNTMKVEINVEKNYISVYNNGDGIPVEIHKEEGVYVPEMIFGHLLTSSNYNDSEKKTTGGRNGYGAKLTNIFSTEFTIETADGKRQRRYKQVFTNNMSKKTEPKITKCKPNENWTKVTFKPDLSKFKMTHLEADVVALMSKRVMDIAGCLGKGVKVELNGERLPIKSFQDYVGLYLAVANKSREEPLPRIYEKVNDRWEVSVSLSDGQFSQVSFCNSIATIRGGTHVQYVADQIVSHILAVVNKKNKTTGSIKPFQIKNHMWVFVNALIDNPTFDSQTKETLTTRAGSFGSKCELSPEFLKKVTKCGIVESLLTWADFKQSKELKKNDGSKRQRITGIPKLDDANDAGGRTSDQCTLILTEGDSAKALAMSGISVVGRDKYGVFPLRGKLLNVREASHKQIMENAEITNIKRILGLQHGKDYDNTKSLRYGHLMIMTDQDHDGSHIKGLLINFIHSFWPSLLKIPSFLVEFITPIVKATNRTRTLAFYTMPEYEAWKESLAGETKGWTIKYYKGLGTSTSKEGKEYFRELVRHKKDFKWESDLDGDAIEMAFSKKKIEARKTWLRHYEPGTFLDMRMEKIKYSDFVNKELILFSMADLSRSIPSMVDGLKPGQRKILFCCFKRNFVREAKVAQFSGYVSEHSAYHHGEQSLASTIIGMAQNFVGSNNINLLSPQGQFGTREQGGKNHASPRYIFTCLSPITRALFPEADDVLLDYLKEDGQSIEPSWYAPIIPMVLINGSEGIGTGWSSFVPNYNPRDVVRNIKSLLRDEEMVPMHPWYKGFKGTIEQSATKETGFTYTITGIIDQVDETTIRISELPVRKWTQDYKEFLDAMLTVSEKNKEPFIKDFREHNTDTKVHFDVSLSEENMAIALAEGLVKKFKLTTTISTNNMHLFNAKGNIKKYDTPEQILEEFYHIRLELYVKRKEVQLETLQYELLKVDNKVRFILGVVKGEIIVNNRKREDLLADLKKKGFSPFPKKTKSLDPPVVGADPLPENEENPELEEKVKGGIKVGDYDYLLSLPIGTLTFEKVEQLQAQLNQMENEVEELKKATPKSLWEKDLDNFLVKLDAQELQEEQDAVYEAKHNAKEGSRKMFKKAPSKKPVVSKAKKPDVQVAEADSTFGKNLPLAPIFNKVGTKRKEPEPGATPRAKSAAKKVAKPVVELEDSDDESLAHILQGRITSYNTKVAAPSVTVENVDSSDSEDEARKVIKTTPKKRPKKKMTSDDDDDSAEWITPEKSRKIQVSPFNKGTTALMSEEGMEGAAARALDRPQRSAGREVKYALSDSSEEENEESDFDNPVFSDTGVFSDGEGD